jgi:hypothetical protein
MALSCTWASDRTGALVMTWTAGGALVRHRRTPRNPGIREGRHRD